MCNAIIEYVRQSVARNKVKSLPEVISKEATSSHAVISLSVDCMAVAPKVTRLATVCMCTGYATGALRLHCGPLIPSTA